jgi:aldose 1-epimerase
LIELAAAGWTARLLPEQGGAFAALNWRGIDVLAPLPTGGDPNASFAGAFLMLPWANRLDAGHLPIAGRMHPLRVNRMEDNTAIHGLSRDLPWQVETAGPANATLVQEVASAPFHYAARLRVALCEAGLRLGLCLRNLAPEAVPMGLGWHPFFRCPAGTRLSFAAKALLTRDSRGLPVAAQPSHGVDGDEAAYAGLDTSFTGWDGLLRLARPDLVLDLQAEGAWARNLQVFAPTDSGILCAEPVSHVPNAPNRPDLAALGPLTMVPPGGPLRAGLSMGCGAPGQASTIAP